MSPSWAEAQTFILVLKSSDQIPELGEGGGQRDPEAHLRVTGDTWGLPVSFGLSWGIKSWRSIFSGSQSDLPLVAKESWVQVPSL